MFNNYDSESFINSLKSTIKQKEDELIELQKKTLIETIDLVKINQLIFEIHELQAQIKYHQDFYTETMMKRCESCSNGCPNGCCRYKFWNFEDI